MVSIGRFQQGTWRKACGFLWVFLSRPSREGHDPGGPSPEGEPGSLRLDARTHSSAVRAKSPYEPRGPWGSGPQRGRVHAHRPPAPPVNPFHWFFEKEKDKKRKENPAIWEVQIFILFLLSFKVPVVTKNLPPFEKTRVADGEGTKRQLEEIQKRGRRRRVRLILAIGNTWDALGRIWRLRDSSLPDHKALALVLGLNYCPASKLVGHIRQNGMDPCLGHGDSRANLYVSFA